MSTNDPPINAVVDVPPGRGIVRFSGSTQFAPGKWVGVELSEPKGKNDGSVQGVEYFKCQMLHGVFVRPSQVKVISRGLPASVSASRTPPAPPSPVTISRPTLGHARAGSNGRIRVPQTAVRNGAPSPASRSDSPQKHSGSGKSTPPTTTITRPRPAGPPSPVKRQSLGASVSTAPPRSSLARSASIRSAAAQPEPPISPKVQRLAEPARSNSPLTASPTSAITSSPPPSPALAVSPVVQAPRPPSALVKEIQAEAEQESQELRAKIRVLEAKRSDDARVIEKLETQLADASHFVALRPKLQQKLASLQQEITGLRRSLADAEQLQSLNEGRLLDAQEQLEMAMLDKEMAEERAETAELELQTLQEKVTSMEAELESVQNGGSAEDSDADPSVRSSLAYVQLEKHNERLKEALLKLRDATRETEQDQRQRVAELERELAETEDLQNQYEATLIKLSNAENQVEDLKLQLDDALGAEELLEQLTERNLMLSEKIEEMRITIEDLEALKELSDELEENHVETEKHLHEEIEQKEAQIREQLRKIAELEESCQDFEGTILQFRELVLQLQSELEMLHRQTENAQNESATAASQTAAMMSLNLKLQSSATKNQARNIDLELRNIEAREAKELLTIIQPYLPQIYIESDTDATYCYLFFQRLAAKVDLISHTLAQAHGLPESLNGTVTDSIIGICELKSRISNLSTLCKRFAAILKRCDVEAFLNIGRIYPEIAPLEKRIDLHLDLLRREEFRDYECAADVNKLLNQFEHLADTYFVGFDFDLGEQELGYAQNLDNDLDMFLASIASTRSSLETTKQDDDVEVESENTVVTLIEPLQRLFDQTKTLKVLTRKLTKRLEDITHDSSALKTHLVPQLKDLNNKVPSVLNFGIQLAQSVIPHLNELRNNKGALRVEKVETMVRQSASSSFGKEQSSEASWATAGEVIAQLIQEAGAVVPLALEPENAMKATGLAPWVVRVEEIKASLAVNAEAERKAAQLNEEIQELARGIRSRDQTIQETSVKIELMERRMDTVKKQQDTITELEAEITAAKKSQRSYEDAVEQLHADLDSAEQEIAKLKALTVGMERQSSVGPQTAEVENTTAIETNLETSYLLEQIEALRGAVRYLRRENSYLKGQDLLREIQSLPPLPEFSRASTPELDESSPSPESGGSDSDSEAEGLRTPPTLQSLAVRTTTLYRDVIEFSATPKVVDLSLSNKRSTDPTRRGRGWMPRKLMPSHQLLERKLEAEALNRRVKHLLDKADALGVGR